MWGVTKTMRQVLSFHFLNVFISVTLLLSHFTPLLARDGYACRRHASPVGTIPA